MQRLLPFVLYAISLSAAAQRYEGRGHNLQLKRVSASYAYFDVDDFGCYPTDLPPFLKKSDGYTTYISNLQWNSYHAGSGGILVLKSYHLNGEFFLAQAKSRFWRQASLQAGLWLTKKEKKLLYGIGNFSNNADYTVQYESYYKPTRVVQFAGAQLGANFRFKLFKPIHFITGLYAQGLIPITLYYRQVWDSLSFDRSTSVRTTKITEGEKLEGRKFYQQQFFIPLGFEASLYKQSVFLRADIDFGILTRYRSTGSSRRMECNGLRGTVSYAFTRRKGLH